MESALPEYGQAEGPEDERPLQAEALPWSHVVLAHEDEQQIDENYEERGNPGDRRKRRRSHRRALPRGKPTELPRDFSRLEFHQCGIACSCGNTGLGVRGDQQYSHIKFLAQDRRSRMQGFCDFDFLSDSCPPAANNYSIQAAV